VPISTFLVDYQREIRKSLSEEPTTRIDAVEDDPVPFLMKTLLSLQIFPKEVDGPLP